MNRKKLHLTIFNSQHEEVFSDFICHIDAVDSHTNVYTKENHSEADVIRIPFELSHIQVQDGKINLYYENLLYAEIVRK
jgi:hypothetical protein